MFQNLVSSVTAAVSWGLRSADCCPHSAAIQSALITRIVKEHKTSLSTQCNKYNSSNFEGGLISCAIKKYFRILSLFIVKKRILGSNVGYEPDVKPKCNQEDIW